MNNKYIFLTLIAILLIGSILYFSQNRAATRTQENVNSSPTTAVEEARQDTTSNNPGGTADTRIGTNNGSTGENTNISLAPTRDPGSHSGQGTVEYANAEGGSGVRLIGVSGIGQFAVLDSTVIVDSTGQIRNFSFIKPGFVVNVTGRPGEGNSIAEKIVIVSSTP